MHWDNHCTLLLIRSSNFNMNLDGNGTTTLDMVTEGRKNNAVVVFDETGDNPPLHKGGIIYISELVKKKSSIVSILHSQLLPISKNYETIYLIVYIE